MTDAEARYVLTELEEAVHDALGLAKLARAREDLQLADDVAAIAWRLAALHDRVHQLVERA